MERGPLEVLFAAIFFAIPAITSGAEPKLELVVQTGHTNRVLAVAISEDGQRVVSGAEDGIAILWDAKTGLQLRSFRGHNRPVCSVAISGDGLRLLTGSYDGTAILWDAKTGQKLQTFPGPTERGYVRVNVALSRDGARALMQTFEATVVWDTRTGQQLKSLGVSNQQINAVALSADGSAAAVPGPEQSESALWDVASGNKVQSFKDEPGFIYSVAVDAGARHLLSHCSNGDIKLRDVQGGRALQTFRNESGDVHSIALSGDGKRVVAGSNFGGSVRVWDADTGRLLQSLQGDKERVHSVAVSHNGGRVVTTDGATAILWDGESGQRLRTFRGRSRDAAAISLDGDGKRLLAGFADNTATLWDLQNGVKLTTLDVNVALDQAGVAPDGRLGWITSVSLNGDGTRALVGSGAHIAVLWDLTNGQKPRVFQGDKQPDVTSIWGVHTVLSRDGKRVVTGSCDQTAIVWDAESGARLHLLRPGSAVSSVAVNGDGTLVVTGASHEAALWDGRTGQKIQSFKWGSIHTVALSDDGKQVLTVSADRIANFWNVAGGQPIQSIRNAAGLALSGDGKRLLIQADNEPGSFLWDGLRQSLQRSSGEASSRRVVGSRGGTIRIWEDGRSSELCSLFSLDGGKEWLVATPEGLFDGSIEATQCLAYRISGTVEFAPLERYQQKYYSPGLLAAIMRGERPQPKVNIQDSLPPSVHITAPAKSRPEIAGATLEVKVEAESRSGRPIQALRLLVDGRPYRGQHGVRNLGGAANVSAKAAWTVELEPGSHTLKVLADTEYARGASDEIEVTIAAGSREPGKVELPKLYVLAIGISNYPGARQLDYAAQDAEDLAAAFRAKSRGLYRDVEAKVITDEKATLAAIFEGLVWLREKMNGKATGIVFFGGHAEVDKADGSLYLLPVNFEEKNLGGTAVDAERFRKQLMAIPGRLILMLDACHAGAIGEPGRKRGAGELTDLLIRDLTAEENGLVVLCSALGHEQSQESNEFRHGLFTWAVLEALRDGKADKVDGAVYVSAVDAYVRKRVKELSKGRQNPNGGTPIGFRDFPLTKP